MQDEALTVIGALAVAQGTVKKAVQDNEEKIKNLTTQVLEDILEK